MSSRPPPTPAEQRFVFGFALSLACSVYLVTTLAGYKLFGDVEGGVSFTILAYVVGFLVGAVEHAIRRRK